MPLLRRDGSWFGTLCALDPLPARLSEEKLGIFQLLASLIGFQLEAEERSRTREQELLTAQQTADLRERFIGILGHDLRNPLQAITMNVQSLLKMEELTEKPTRAVRRIAKSAERIDSMVADLLDFARGRLGGGMPISPQPVDAAQLVGSTVDELQAVHPARDLVLTVDASESVQWDEGRMAQVFSNLIGNALGHSPEGSTVRVTLSATDADLTFETWNTGEPISQQQLARLFEPYHRAVESGSSSSSGLGLGLFIARQIVEAHGGQIEARSSRDEGTTFTVRLPRRAVSARKS